MKTKNVKTITLILTQDCNLDCIYCYEHNKTKYTMDLNTAKSIINHHLQTNDDYYTVFINLFGGEPFLQFELIKEIYEYTKQVKTSKKIVFNTTTNGTLVHGRIQEWLYNHRDDFSCGLSADGTESMHNYNRSNSYSNIDFNFFKTTWPSNPVKITVSPYTLNTLAEGIIHLHEMGFNVSGSIAYGIDWNEYNLIDILDRELLKLIKYYENNPDIKPCGMLDYPIQLITGDIPDKIKKWCGSGVEMYTYDVDGKCYPCQYFLPATLGNDLAMKFVNKRFERTMQKEELNHICRNCSLIFACPTCNGSNYLENGMLYYKSSKYCDIIKRMLLATSKIRWIRYKQGLYNDMNDLEKYELFTGISTVQKVVGSDYNKC